MVRQYKKNYGVVVAVATGLFAGGAVRAQNADFKGFPDVPKTHWAYQAVTELAQKGVLQGYPVKKRAGKLTFNTPNVKAATQAVTAKPNGNKRKP